MNIRSILAAVLAFMLAGCAAHKPPASVKLTGCKIVQNIGPALSCDCIHPKLVGWDAKTRAAIYRCE